MTVEYLTTEYLLTKMMSELHMGEGLFWLAIPAAIQWLILRNTQDRRRGLRLALLAPALWVLHILFVMFLLLLVGSFLVCLFLGEIFQADLLSSALQLALEFLRSRPVLHMLARLGLLLAGWGLGWAAFALENGQLAAGYPPRGSE